MSTPTLHKRMVQYICKVSLFQTKMAKSPKNPNRNPRYKQNKEKNPVYKDWRKARYQGNTYDFQVPTTKVSVPFDVRALTPYPNPGVYGSDNYDIGANRVIEYMNQYPDATPMEAIGVVANELKESGTNPSAIQGINDLSKMNIPTPRQLANPLGIGRLQLSEIRKRQFLDFVGNNAKKAVDPYYQTEFMRLERAGKIGTEKGNYAAIGKANNPAEAAWIAASRMVRPNPSQQHFIDRMENADSIYSRLVQRYNQTQQPQPVAEPSVMTRLQKFVPEAWDKIISIFD